MDRHHRKLTRGAAGVNRLNSSARMLDRALDATGVPERDKPAFMRWAMASMWNTFKEERMQKRLMIENEVRNLGLRFPNGTVLKKYETEFRLPTHLISNVELVGADELGLHLLADGEETDRYYLTGKPTKAGDFLLTLRFDTVEGEPASEFQIPIAFNPNPRSLWKNIPTNLDIPHYKPDSDTAYIQVEAGADGEPRKDIVVASQRGRSHAQEGKARDDDFGVYHCKDSDWYIMAVADGAGSAKFSRKGSQVACRTVLDHCKSLLLDNPEFEEAIREYAADRENCDKRSLATRHVYDIVYRGALKAHEAVKQVAAADEGTSLRDFATTLMFAICKKYDFGWFVASYWVGDGAMCLLDTEGKSIKLLGTPDEGEFSGQTRFLTMPEIFRDPDAVQKRLRMAIVPDFTALILMSDGVSDPMFETDKNLNSYAKWEEFYGKLQAGFPDDTIGGVDLADDNPAAKDQLLGWLDFWSPGNHDDRTIAILY